MIGLPQTATGRRALKARYARLALLSEFEVERRAIRGVITLRTLPDREAAWLRVKSNYPEVLRDYSADWRTYNDYVPPFRPTPFDMSDFLTALSWINGLAAPDQRLIWYASFQISRDELAETIGQGISWRPIAERIGKSETTARNRYRDAISNCWLIASQQIEAALNEQAGKRKWA